MQSDVTSRKSGNDNKNNQYSSEEGISCSPNPFREELIVRIEKNGYRKPLFTYQFINILGQVVGSGVLTDGDNIIGTKNIGAGTYMLVIFDEEQNQKHIEKLIKN